jgi:glutamyl-Q tRNA(Asp) synthetase
MLYIGRFAPSPTGPLHFGSLVAAVASYCDAKAHQGQWLLRIEDIDPPRIQTGASDIIRAQLQAYGLIPDDRVVYQQSRYAAYEAALAFLSEQQRIFYCTCSRTQLHGQSRYSGTCRRHHTPLRDSAIRLRVDDNSPVSFKDLILGMQHSMLDQALGDFVIKRRDGLYAYQLAVVVDDAWQGVTHIIRGADLLDNTARQIYLQHCLGVPTPVYGHIPLAIDHLAQKLSKQNLAQAIPIPADPKLLRLALHHLGQAAPPFSLKTCTDILNFGISMWRREAIPQLAQYAPE